MNAPALARARSGECGNEDGVRIWVPGRTELAGNHLDHQGGRVVAATVDCGINLVAQPNASGIVRVESAGFAPVAVAVGDLAARAAERGTSAALVRGVLEGLRAAGVSLRGFDAVMQSSIPAGSGLSSSAAFELAVAKAALAMAVDGSAGDLAPADLARIAQAAERDWFGKPCGLMDQLSIALGGVNIMDFGATACASGPVALQAHEAAALQPDAYSNEASLELAVEGVSVDWDEMGLALFLVDVHCDHSRHTAEYAQVAKDMAAVAAYFGAPCLRAVTEERFLQALADVRRDLGDACALRGLHFYNEMQLVDERAEALRCADAEAFLRATRRSGASSARFLQNVSVAGSADQPAMVALALAERLLGECGAARIHGGGFGGTIQVFAPVDQADRFSREMDAFLGAGSCRRYRITNP